MTGGLKMGVNVAAHIYQSHIFRELPPRGEGPLLGCYIMLMSAQVCPESLAMCMYIYIYRNVSLMNTRTHTWEFPLHVASLPTDKICKQTIILCRQTFVTLPVPYTRYWLFLMYCLNFVLGSLSLASKKCWFQYPGRRRRSDVWSDQHTRTLVGNKLATSSERNSHRRSPFTLGHHNRELLTKITSVC